MITRIIPVYRQTLDNGKTVILKNVKVFDALIGSIWQEIWPADSILRLERAIERRFPDYFHRFTKKGKHFKNCPACKQLAKES